MDDAERAKYIVSIPLPQWALDLLDQQQQRTLEAYQRFISMARHEPTPTDATDNEGSG